MLQDDKVITIDQVHQVVNDVAAETIGYNVTQRSVKTECRRYMTGILPIRRKTQYNQSRQRGYLKIHGPSSKKEKS